MRKLLLIVVIVIAVFLFFPQVRSSLNYEGVKSMFSSPLATEIRGKIAGEAISLYENVVVIPLQSFVSGVKVKAEKLILSKVYGLFGRDLTQIQ